MKARNVFSAVYKSGPVDTMGANAIIFINEGTSEFLINNIKTVKPDNSFSVSQVVPEVVDISDYEITFLEGAPGDQLINKCVIVRTFISKSIC